MLKYHSIDPIMQCSVGQKLISISGEIRHHPYRIHGASKQNNTPHCLNRYSNRLSHPLSNASMVLIFQLNVAPLLDFALSLYVSLKSRFILCLCATRFPV